MVVAWPHQPENLLTRQAQSQVINDCRHIVCIVAVKGKNWRSDEYETPWWSGHNGRHLRSAG